MAVDEAAGLADEHDAVLGSRLVFTEEDVKDAVVPVRFGGRIGRVGARWGIGRAGEEGRRRTRELGIGRKLGTGLQGIRGGHGATGGGTLSALDISRRRRRHASAARDTLSRAAAWLVLAVHLIFGVVFGAALLLLALCRSFAAVLLDQLHSGVILGGILELLNSLCALLLVVLEASAKALDAKVVVSGEGRASSVDAVILVSASKATTGLRSSQQRSAAQAGPFVCAEVLISDNEQQDDGVNEVGKGKVEGPKNSGAAGVGSDLVEGGLCVGDLARERGQGLFEVGGFALARV